MQNTCRRHEDGSGDSRGHRHSASTHPSIHRPPPQWVDDYRPHHIAVLCNSNTSSFLAAVHVTAKAVFYEGICLFDASAIWQFTVSWIGLEEWLLSMALYRHNIRGYFFSGLYSPWLCLFVIYLNAIMVNNLVNSMWEQLSWCSYFLRI